MVQLEKDVQAGGEGGLSLLLTSQTCQCPGSQIFEA